MFLRRSGQFLRTNKKSLVVEMENVNGYSGHGKEYNFKVWPKHKTRIDGEAICYNDVIQLSDFLGRFIACDKSFWAILSELRSEGTSFRILPFISHGADLLQTLKGGHIVQFYHTEHDSWIAAVDAHEKKVPIPSVSVEALPSINFSMDSST